MKIVDVNPFFYPLYGGIEHRMHLVCKGLAERGHDVTILTSQLPGTKLEETTEFGYKIIRLPSRYIEIYNPPYVSSKNVLETLNKIDADIINYNYRWAPSFDKDLGLYEGTKVFTYHNKWGEGVGIQAKISNINDNHFAKILNTFDHIICVSEYVRQDLIKHGYSENNTTTIPSCLGEFPEVSEREDDYILSLGRLVRTKGLDYLIEAMETVDTKLIVCGKGPDKKRLERSIRKHHLEDKVEIRGWVSEEEKNDLMAGCKLFVMPSLIESYGLAATELMSHGKPIVSTNVDGLPDTVRNGGLLVDPKDAKALSKAINDLLSDDKKRALLGKNARAISETQTAEATTDKVENVFLKVLENKKR